MLWSRRSLLGMGLTLAGAEGAQPAQPSKPLLEIPPGPLPRPSESSPGPARRRWELQYTFDKDREKLALGDIAFSSAARGMSIGMRFKDSGSEWGVLMRTSDGGANWRESRIDGRPLSLFVLDDAHSWVVTHRDLQFSDEAGARWRSLRLPKGVHRVHFLSPLDGFAYGQGIAFFRTKDGGRHWDEVKESKALNLNPDYTVWHWMEFVTPQAGIAVCSSQRPDSSPSFVPDWMVPERIARRRLVPGSIATLSTYDKGMTWKQQVTSGFGRGVKVRIRGSLGVSLMHYNDGFEWPSEVLHNDLRTGENGPIFRRRDLHVTDMELSRTVGTVLAAIEAPGQLRNSAVWGRPHVVCSNDHRQWFDMKVDYLAEGTRASLARSGEEDFWISTSAGQVLRLAP